MSSRRHGLRAFARRAILALACAALTAPAPAPASTALEALYISPDITLNLNGVVVEPRSAVRTFPQTLADLGALPAGANLVGYHRAADGRQLFTLDVTVAFPGGVTATSSDVVAYDGIGYSLELNGLARGVPRGVQIDAVGVVDGDLLLSFDTAVSFSGFTAEDEDLVRVSDASISLFIDGSAAGVAPGLDLDAAERLSNGHLLLSFDGSGSLGGVSFDDDDILEYNPDAGTWERIFDGSAEGASFAGLDIDAVAAEEIATVTPTGVATATPPPTQTSIPTATATPLPATQTATAVPTETEAAVPTDTPTEPPTRTLVPTETATSPPSTATATATPPASATVTDTPVVTATPTATGEPPTPTETSEAVTPTPTATPSPEASATPTQLVGFLAGDANCDARVNVADVTEVIDLVGRSESQCGSDANCDGATNSADIAATAGLIFVVPAACPVP